MMEASGATKVRIGLNYGAHAMGTLPHGRRPADVGRQLLRPIARRQEPLHLRHQHLRHRRRAKPHADGHGDCRPIGRLHCEIRRTLKPHGACSVVSRQRPMLSLTPNQLATLTALANGVIPADDLDAGASAVNAAASPRRKGRSRRQRPALSQRPRSCPIPRHRKVQLHYAQSHVRPTPRPPHPPRDVLPAFFKQLRMDVSALYLSDPDVWRRIGFPGPSTAAGGHPDFAQPQRTLFTQIGAGRRPADASHDKR